MCRHLGVLAVFVLIVSLLTLTSCDVTGTPSVSGSSYLAPLATQEYSYAIDCEECAQATLSALLTQEKNYSDAQAAATAAIMRANAQATLNASGATLSAAMTQEQNNANVIAAEVAATAAIVRANAQATLVAAGSTQSAAQTQDVIRQTQMAELATVAAEATLNQQNKDEIANSTQTAVANHIATQTQSSVATAQWYTDQERQREEERQGPLTFLWLWCPPLFLVSIALVLLIFLWRWMKIREMQQSIEMQQASAPVIIEHERRQIIDVANNQYPAAKSTDNVRRWLDEVKRKLIIDKKDDDDAPDR